MKLTAIYGVLFLQLTISSCTGQVVQHPIDTTVCQGDNAGFTCVIFIQSGALIIPGWLRNGTNVDRIRHEITDNLTNISTAPAYISSRVTVSSVTVFDDGSLYQCDIISLITSNNATLKVVASPSTAPNITVLTPFSSRSFTVSWTITDPDHNYIVTWTNLHTGMMNNVTVPENTNSYMVTGLNGVDNYNVSVTANNSCGMMMSDPITVNAIHQVTGVALMCESVQLLHHQCTVSWKSVTQQHITGYLVSHNGTVVYVNNSTTTLTFTAPSLPDGVFIGSIVVVVSAVNQFGVGPTSEPVTVEISVPSSVTNDTAITLISTFVAKQLYEITVTCTIHPDSTADHCVVMAMANGKVTKTGTASVANGIAMVEINGLECEITYSIIAGGTINESLIGPKSLVGNVTAGLCPLTTNDESNNEHSTGTVIAITCVITFIITLVSSSLITCIITRRYYKHMIDDMKRTAIKQERGIRQYDPAYAVRVDSPPVMTIPSYEIYPMGLDLNLPYASD